MRLVRWVQGFRYEKSGELRVFLPALELHEETLFDLFRVERLESVNWDPYQLGPAFGILQNGVFRGVYIHSILVRLLRAGNFSSLRLPRLIKL